MLILMCFIKLNGLFGRKSKSEHSSIIRARPPLGTPKKEKERQRRPRSLLKNQQRRSRATCSFLDRLFLSSRVCFGAKAPAST